MAPLTLPHSIDAGTAATANEVQSNFVAIRDAINGDLEGGTGNNLKANGVTARELADNLLLRGMPAQNMQEGVVAAGDLKVTPGSNLVLNYAAGTAWVTDDSGVLSTGALIPVTVTASTVTIGANASGNPRIDQIILTMTGHATGTVSVLAGTATAGATLENRTGAASLPSDAVRLADILMPNGFAGPFVQNTHIRDRRPWARGFNARDPITANTNTGTTGNILKTIRMEASGVPVRVVVSGVLFSNTSGISQAPSYGIRVDGVSTVVRRSTELSNTVANGNNSTMESFDVEITVSAGSRKIDLTNEWGGDLSGTLVYSSNTGPEFRVEEVIRQSGSNSGA